MQGNCIQVAHQLIIMHCPSWCFSTVLQKHAQKLLPEQRCSHGTNADSRICLLLGEEHTAVRRRQPRQTGSPLADSVSEFTPVHGMLERQVPNQASRFGVSMQDLQDEDVHQIADEVFEALLQDAVDDMTASGLPSGLCVLLNQKYFAETSKNKVFVVCV